jgi:hypothetical protein
MVALGLWTGTASDEELAAEAARFGSESLYAARLANALQGAAQHQVLLAEQAAMEDGATPEQIDDARHEAYPGDAFESGPALAGLLRWQVLRLGLVLRRVNQKDVGPVWLAAAHAADGLQLLLSVCEIASPDDPQAGTLPEDLAGALEALANARTNIEILTTLAGATMPEPSYAHRRTARARPDFTDEQVAMLVESFDTTLHKADDIIDMLERYAEAGGRDYDTYERMLDHLAREGTHFTQGGRSALAPDVWKRAAAAVAEAAGVILPDGGLREALHQRVAMSVLATVWFAGQHHFVEPADWPDELPAVVLGAVRRAPGINEDPSICNPYRAP